MLIVVTLLCAAAVLALVLRRVQAARQKRAMRMQRQRRHAEQALQWEEMMARRPVEPS